MEIPPPLRTLVKLFLTLLRRALCDCRRCIICLDIDQVKLNHKKRNVRAQGFGHHRNRLVLQVLEEIHIDAKSEIKRIQVNEWREDLICEYPSNMMSEAREIPQSCRRSLDLE